MIEEKKVDFIFKSLEQQIRIEKITCKRIKSREKGLPKNDADDKSRHFNCCKWLYLSILEDRLADLKETVKQIK